MIVGIVRIMTVNQYRENRERLQYDKAKPLYHIRRHIDSEKCDVVMGRNNGVYSIQDATPCSDVKNCKKPLFEFRLSKNDATKIERYMTAYFKRIDANMRKRRALSSIRNEGAGVSGNSDNIPIPSLNGGKKS